MDIRPETYPIQPTSITAIRITSFVDVQSCELMT